MKEPRILHEVACLYVGSLENVHATLKTCLLEAEEMLHALTEKSEADDGNSFSPYVAMTVLCLIVDFSCLILDRECMTRRNVASAVEGQEVLLSCENVAAFSGASLGELLVSISDI